MNKFISGLKGFVIGVSNVVPGISSGTLMIIFNIYNRIVDAANLFFKQPFKAIMSILDIIIGIVLGLIGSFLLVSLVYELFPLAVTFLILGLVFGGYKTIYDEIKGKSNIVNIIILIISATIIVILPFITPRDTIADGLIYYIILVILGLFVAFAAVAPGISGTLMLVIFGYYSHILEIGRNFLLAIFKGQFKDAVPYVLPFTVLAVSIIIGLVVSIKLIKKIIDKFETKFYFAVMGMLLASPVAILVILNEQIAFTEVHILEWIIGSFLLLVGFFFVYLLIYLENKRTLNEKQKEELIEEV